MSRPFPWLFSPRKDLVAFGGSALLSLALIGLGVAFGWVDGDTPGWAWIACVLLVDVAHVWSTLFRVYLDPEEWRRRPWLYLGIPVCAYILGVALYSEGALLFWMVVAYLAVFHFVKQQAGWVLLYRGAARDFGEWSRRFDLAAIYAATLYPLFYWHTHLPADFAWMVEGDFLRLEMPTWSQQVARAAYGLALGSYLLRSLAGWVMGTRQNPGLDLVVGTTALCWHVGIVWFASDYAFTVTNVFIHGVPYVFLIHAYCQHRQGNSAGIWIGAASRYALLLPMIVVVLAYGEELLWHKAVWRESPWLFGEAWFVSPGLLTWLVPLLAVPQLTHYALDGFVWRRRHNPTLAGMFASASGRRQGG